MWYSLYSNNNNKKKKNKKKKHLSPEGQSFIINTATWRHKLRTIQLFVQQHIHDFRLWFNMIYWGICYVTITPYMGLWHCMLIMNFVHILSENEGLLNPVLLRRPVTDANRLTNGSVGFIWNLCCHWLRGLWRHQFAVVIEAGYNHPNLVLIFDIDEILWFIQYIARIWPRYSLRGLHIRITWFSLYGIRIPLFSWYGIQPLLPYMPI